MKAEMIAFAQLSGYSNFLSIHEQIARARGISAAQLLTEALDICIAEKERLDSQ